jgi:hypothetical protein
MHKEEGQSMKSEGHVIPTALAHFVASIFFVSAAAFGAR